MLARKVRLHYLRPDVSGREIHVNPLPAILPIGISEETAQDFSVEITLAFEIAVKAAMGQTRARHDLLYRHVLKTVAIKQPARAINDVSFHFRAMTGRIGHVKSSFRAFFSTHESMHWPKVGTQRKYYLEHILLSWSDAGNTFASHRE
jgi:hypothetical protein